MELCPGLSLAPYKFGQKLIVGSDRAWSLRNSAGAPAAVGATSTTEARILRGLTNEAVYKNDAMREPRENTSGRHYIPRSPFDDDDDHAVLTIAQFPET